VTYLYQVTDTSTLGFGSFELTRNAPIATCADIESVRDHIQENYTAGGKAMVLNWRELPEESREQESQEGVQTQ